jgi:hypothetical protein
LVPNQKPLKLYTRAIKILDATFGLVSNNEWLLNDPEFFSEYKMQCLLTNVYKIDDIPFGPNLDAYFYIYDIPNVPPTMKVTDNAVFVTGPISELDAKMADRRYSIFGNLGLFFKYSMATLERHGIYSFHASAMYNPENNELMAVVGGAGAGKTVFILEGISRGYQIFTVEMLHFAFRDEGLVFYKGALMDNIRIGNLVYDFPKAAERLGAEIPKVDDVWGTKIALDFRPMAPKEDVIVNPKLSFFFPRIEAGRDPAIINDITKRNKLKWMLYNNAVDKIGGSNLFYETIPCDTMDTPELMAKRERAMERLVSGEFEILRAKNILAGTHNCMEGL